MLPTFELYITKIVINLYFNEIWCKIDNLMWGVLKSKYVKKKKKKGKGKFLCKNRQKFLHELIRMLLNMIVLCPYSKQTKHNSPYQNLQWHKRQRKYASLRVLALKNANAISKAFLAFQGSKTFASKNCKSHYCKFFLQ